MPFDPKSYDWWNAALANPSKIGSPELPVHEGEPHTGFYAMRKVKNGPRVGVAIWQQDGHMVAVSGTHSVDPHRVWTYCCRGPISYEVYTNWANGAGWPEEIQVEVNGEKDSTDAKSPGMGHNSGLTDFEILRDQIAEWNRAAKEALGRGLVESKAEADQLSDLATKIGDLEKEVEAKRKAEKEPFLKAGREIDNRYNDIRDSAKEMKRALKNAVGDWLQRERDRVRKEQEAERERLAAMAKDDVEAAAVAAAPPQETKVKAGTRGSVVLTKRKVTVVTDLPACSAYIAALNSPPVEFTDAVKRIAGRMLAAGVEVPGAHTDIVEEAR